MKPVTIRILLIRITSSSCCYALIYVDDLTVMEDFEKDLDVLIKSSNKNFALKDMGKLSCLLGVEVSYLTNGSLFLSQSKYIIDLQHKTKMLGAKSIATQMVNGLLLSAHYKESFHVTYMYRSVVGALQYATLTHPKISYNVNKACQFMRSHKLEH